MKTNLNLGNPPTPAIDFSESLKSNYKNHITSFLSSIEEDIKSSTPYDAVEILSVLTNFQDFFISDELWGKSTQIALEIIREGIYNSNFSAYSAYSGLSYVSFAVSELSRRIPSMQRFLHSLNFLQADALSTLPDLCKPSTQAFTYNHFELISGLSGALRYWLDVDEPFAPKVSHDIVTALIVNSSPKHIAGVTVLGWQYYTSEVEAKHMLLPAPNGCINYSVSHGMGGPLMALSYAYHKGIEVDGLLETIHNLIHEYKISYYRVNGIIYWPGRITFEQYTHQIDIPHTVNRMSWCYGSAGILRVLYLSAQYLSNHELERWALDELIKIAKMENKDYLFDSPIICHGYAGVALIMNEMYRDTLNPVFREKTISLLELIDQMLNDPQVTKELKQYSYLEGYSGIFQAVTSIFNGAKSENMKRLLII